jgi:hypothetical protein
MKVRGSPKGAQAREAGLRTKGGILLTSAVEAELTAEAEQGYDTAKLRRRLAGRRTHGSGRTRSLTRTPTEDLSERP